MDGARDTSEKRERKGGGSENERREEVQMSTKRIREGEKGGERERQTDREPLKFMAFFIFRAENQYCLLWMR